MAVIGTHHVYRSAMCRAGGGREMGKKKKKDTEARREKGKGRVSPMLMFSPHKISFSLQLRFEGFI
jgi:hypothetical protein